MNKTGLQLARLLRHCVAEFQESESPAEGPTRTEFQGDVRAERVVKRGASGGSVRESDSEGLIVEKKGAFLFGFFLVMVDS